MIDKRDPRTFWALASFAFMVALMVVAIYVLLDINYFGQAEKLQALAVLAPLVAATMGSVYRLQYLHESRTMMAYVTNQVLEIRSDMKQFMEKNNA